MDVRALLRETYRAALDGVRPEALLAPHLTGTRPHFVLAFGKAAVPMARVALEAFPGVPALVVPPVWEDVPGAEVIAGSHPVPDTASVRAAERALERLSAHQAGQTVLVLVSGGGSALLCAPDGVTLEQKGALTRALLRAGADIRELNTVRKHLSRVKGGRLAAATRAHIRALLLSDVVGDDPATIASGPTVPDPSTFADALAVLDRYGVDAPETRAHLHAGLRGDVPETPKALPDVSTTVIGSTRLLLEAARTHLEGRGVRAVILGDAFVGDVQEVARSHAAAVRDALTTGKPVVLISGGEATVRVRGNGVGGRNTEFALWLLRELDGVGVHALSAGSDGVDGSSHAAGAFLTPDTQTRADRAGLDSAAFLNRNDAASFFAALGDLLVTGPSGHNLNDLRLIAVNLG
ncbi:MULTISPECIES: glycerate kinase type-2 family protein [Deinococcus]|uniref:Glycerate kinase n=1 Tax=Deinococcus rufus TaxID=2136097 RepID=A0ABV7Z2P8_9DEIO|nr:glycerate kinase [Deinococcus sp. AB2017081]WQE95176.1 glycerate kinase [Deinococcus sp. AB2017081]